MRIYYDTEFLENGSTIDLISIGMVREDGAEYYAVSADMHFGAAVAHDWLRKNVVPYLPMRSQYGPTPTLDLGHPDVKPRKQIAAEVKDFVLGAPDPKLWAYFGAYDHVALCQLYGTMMDLPDGFPMYTHDLKQEMNRQGIDKSDLPAQGDNLHKAIDDARWNRRVGEFLGLSSPPLLG